MKNVNGGVLVVEVLITIFFVIPQVKAETIDESVISINESIEMISNLTSGTSIEVTSCSSITIEVNETATDTEETVSATTEEIAEVTSEMDTEEITEVTIEEVTESTNEINSYELNLMSHLIYGEAGDQSDECQRAVGSVVLNRVKHERYPDTIEEVIFQKGQYACTWDGNFKKEPSKQALKNARWLLSGNITLPDNVIYQSQFVQGDGVYKKIGTEIFCYEN